MSYSDYLNKISAAEKQLTYLNNRIRGVNKALGTADNKAVIKALNDELRSLQSEINTQNKIIKESRYLMRMLEERDRNR
jgi:predicted  nucleic acid-binding Zn-ribbon protein